MVKINLLPWREERRQQRQQAFVMALGVAAITSGLVFLAGYLYVEALKGQQTRRNNLIDSEIKVALVKIKEIKDIEQKKGALLNKIEVIYNLQESRPQIVHLFDELSKRTPEGIFLTKFVQSGENLSFTGNAKTNARVSAYMRGIDKSLWLGLPELKEIQVKGKDKKAQYNKFSMLAKQVKPSKDNETKKTI